MKNTSLRKNITVAFLAAISFLIMLVQFPLPLFPSFLQFDLSDIPAIIGAIIFGPLAGIAIEAIKNLLHWLIIGSPTGVPVGEIANFIAGAIFIYVTTYFYRRKRTTGRLALGMAVGTIIMTVLMSIANYFIIFPSYALFLGFSVDTAVKLASAANHSIHNLLTLIVLGVLPYNIIKGIFVIIVAVPIYTRLRPRLGIAKH
ncbi:ECF transporter S component [Pullulanibacillus sp. KACC 23026]|nr:ECF transporter S component [Pullulanibacillus sp. KACC 23026]WEG11988.1 ECF transporter S component [Pullulanibacillus sp. KACC 23026]